MAQVDIYVEHRPGFFQQRNYKLHYMLRGLHRANLTYRVLDQWDLPNVSERAFVHVNLTELPPNFRHIHEHYAQCVNGRAITISRLLYSTARIHRQDAYDGPVIVKTVLNSRGKPELRFKRSRRTKLGKVMHRLRRWWGLPDTPRYRVYPSLLHVPSSVWSDRRLMVERFIPAQLNLPITKHRLDFFYDVELNTRSTFNSLLCDAETVVGVESVSDIPDEVLAVRRALKLDFGAIDYFVTGNRACVIDANKTVSITPAWMERFPVLARHVESATDRLIEFVRAS